jgi:hypothetical protein
MPVQAGSATLGRSELTGQGPASPNSPSKPPKMRAKRLTKERLPTRARRSRRGLVVVPWLMLVASSAAGCDEPATQLVVVVDSDYRVPAELAAVTAEILDGTGTPVSSQEFVLTAEATEAEATRFTVPFSFAVVPVGGDASRRITVEVSGLAALGGEPLVTRRAITGFLPERSLRLPMFLASACEGRPPCSEGQTCTRSGCQSADVPPESLPVARPGEELRFDAGQPSDAGPRDGALFDGDGADAAVVDSSVADGSVPDGGYTCPSTCPAGCSGLSCVDGESCVCDDSCNCRLSCPSSGCQSECRSDCVVDAASTVDLEATCRASCQFDARRSEGAQITCRGGSRCHVDCRGADTCRVTCRAGAQCVLECSGASSCAFASCMVMARSCDGDVQVCGRSCP